MCARTFNDIERGVGVEHNKLDIYVVIKLRLDEIRECCRLSSVV